MVHEIPFDDPERLRARLRSRYPIVSDRVIGAGRLPNTRLQQRLARLPRVGVIDRVLTWTHWLWFFEPYVSLAMVLVRNNERFPRAARQMAAVFDIGCAVYFAVPTAPPWWSSEEGLTGEEVRRIMVEVGEDTWGSAWPKMYDALGGNPWAAMPSLHFATSLVAALSLLGSRQGRGGARLDLRRHARLRPRLPRRALRHRSPRRGGPGGGGQARRAAGRAARARRHPRSAPIGAPGQRVASLECLEGSGERQRERRDAAADDAAAAADARRRRPPARSASTSSSRSWSASATRWTGSTRRIRSGSASRSPSTSLPTRPTSPSSRRWSVATRCG